MKKITVLYGNYGSGKTELALNIALALRRSHTDVSLIDLDIVNPYFRSSEHKAMLESKGIRVIAPVYANTLVDLPAIPPDVFSAFHGGYAVFDCGGDPVGAAALGGLKPYFDGVRGDTQVLYVVNTKRPFQDSAGRIAQSLGQIQSNARLFTDGFVFNANLGKETTGEELVDGYVLIGELVEKTGVPLRYVSGTKDTLDVFRARYPDYRGEMIEIGIFMRPEWM